MRSAATLLFLTMVVTQHGICLADSAADIAAARQTFLKDMRKKSPTERASAVTEYAKYPIEETLEILLKRGLDAHDPPVRLATRQAVREAGKYADSAKFLNEEFKRYVKKQFNEEILCCLLEGMISATDEAGRDEAIKTLDDYLASPKGNLIIPMALIDDLGQQNGPEAVELIKVLSRAKPFEKVFGYRRCVVQAMTKSREPSAIGFLVQILPTTTGLVQADIIDHLTRVTKQKFKDNDRDWTNWWIENQATFKFPKVVDDGEVSADLHQTTYYGIPICAKRIVFVLDTSGSMRGLPMETAKVALLKTIDSLPEAVNFDVVLFDKTTAVWQPRLVPASRMAKQAVAETVMSRGLGLGTASHAALNAAFNLNPEVIYFLSDGEPTDGQPATIVESMVERNRTRRVTIHTIGVVTQRNGGAGLTYFMKPLAERNTGVFRLVE